MKDICRITRSCYRDFAEQIAAGIMGAPSPAPVAGGQPPANVENTEALGGKEGKAAPTTKEQFEKVFKNFKKAE